jgi:hypothetical protein
MSMSGGINRFAKEQPGADLVFQPSDLGDYAKDAWDIRISIGDAPLDEAFYFTVNDSDAVRLTIGQLLDQYALNPERRSELDVAEYPELPFLQEELIQYVANERKGLLDLDWYVNHNTLSGPVNLHQTARTHLSVCTYHDGSEDYRVLDLILVPSVREPSPSEINRMRREYGELFLLLLLDYQLAQGDAAMAAFVEEPAVDAWLKHRPEMAYRHFMDGMKDIENRGLIMKQVGEEALGSAAGQGVRVELTKAGRTRLDGIMDEYQSAADYYNQFDSVSIAPPGLGVPDGFDARVQMMEYDGLDCERTLVIQILAQGRDEWFTLDEFHEAYDSFLICDVVREALAYKTNFSAEVLDSLRELAAV